MDVRLGKLNARTDPRTIRYGDILTSSAENVSAPESAHWGNGLPLTMLANDRYGCCVESGGGHLVELWTDKAGLLVQPTDTQALGLYTILTGFNPADPATDQGTDVLSMYNWLRKNPYPGTQVKFDAFATLDPQKSWEIEEAVAWYGGAGIGLQLPLTAQDQTGPGETWDVVAGTGSAAGSWGGHFVPVTGYDDGGLYVYTWATLQRMSWDFLETYCDEAYVAFSYSWLEKSGLSPSHLARGTLATRLANL